MRTQRRLGRLSLLAILTMLAGLILAGPAHATFPGPNGQIAFLEGTTGQLYTINPDGTGLRQLTHLSPHPSRPDRTGPQTAAGSSSPTLAMPACT